MPLATRVSGGWPQERVYFSKPSAPGPVLTDPNTDQNLWPIAILGRNSYLSPKVSLGVISNFLSLPSSPCPVIGSPEFWVAGGGEAGNPRSTTPSLSHPQGPKVSLDHWGSSEVSVSDTHKQDKAQEGRGTSAASL